MFQQLFEFIILKYKNIYLKRKRKWFNSTLSVKKFISSTIFIQKGIKYGVILFTNI